MIAHEHGEAHTVRPARSRLFVAVWPPPEVVDRLGRLDRPVVEGVRWTQPNQWHVTLRFLGWIDDIEAVRDALLHGLPVSAADAVLGPAVELLNPRILAVPVTGLDEVAAAVVDATRHLGQLPERRRFHGHVTLARMRGVGRGRARSLAGAAVDGQWPVASVALVESRLSSSGAAYTTIGEFSLHGP